MAKQMFIDLDFQGLKISKADLEYAGAQVTNDIAALTTTIQNDNDINTKRIFVLNSVDKLLYVWDGGGVAGAFEIYGGSNVTEITVRGGLDQASTVISGATITDGTAYSNIKNGHTFVFNGVGGPATLPANLGGEQVSSGDRLIFAGIPAGQYATNAELTNPANWFVLQSNVEAATDTSLGLVSLASDAEVKAGAQGSPAPTVVQSNQIGQRQYTSGTINLAANTPSNVLHSLGTQNVTVVVRKAGAPNAGSIIDTNVVIVDNDNLTIEVNKAINVIAYVSSW
jgi:hypothetical protein